MTSPVHPQAHKYYNKVDICKARGQDGGECGWICDKAWEWASKQATNTSPNISGRQHNKLNEANKFATCKSVSQRSTTSIVCETHDLNANDKNLIAKQKKRGAPEDQQFETTFGSTTLRGYHENHSWNPSKANFNGSACPQTLKPINARTTNS